LQTKRKDECVVELDALDAELMEGVGFLSGVAVPVLEGGD
jgi:hypothetical protein